MVRFFNQKEEVISIELTPYGKEQFSKGLFSPAFYAFYDGSVIYDGAYASLTESQNQVTNRIKNETPKIKPTTRFSTTPGSVFSLASAMTSPDFAQSDVWNAKYNRFIGNSDPNSQNNPSWNISLMDSSDIGFNDGVEYRVETTIPQMSATLMIDYNRYTDPDDEESYSYELIKSDRLLLDIQEFNTVFKNNGNFDIEVMKSGSDGKLSPLMFVNDETTEAAVDIDTDFSQPEQSLANGYKTLGSRFVSFYLSVLADDNIIELETESNSSMYKRSINRDPRDICVDIPED